MKISVLIPTYNSAATIEATLNSVLTQTIAPDEILILDDGSTDNTIHILESYKPSIKVFQQANQGVAHARNVLCEHARGDLIGFLDHDDIWHPRYLEVQARLFRTHGNAVAFFTGHVNFYGDGLYLWQSNPLDRQVNIELIAPLDFFKRYNKETGPFSSMSYCCVPKSVLMKMGKEPFCVSGVDDSYLCNVLSLIGPVVYYSIPLVAYRITKDAQSTNKLRDLGLWVKVFQLLEDRFRSSSELRLYRAFMAAFAAKRRSYAKRLMGAGQTSEARRQLWFSLFNTSNPISTIKSWGLLFLSFMPALLQPKWPSSYRELVSPDCVFKENETGSHE